MKREEAQKTYVVNVCGDLIDLVDHHEEVEGKNFAF